MIVLGLTRLASTILSLIWPADNRAPAPDRLGARSPWKRSSGNGPLWQSRQRPTCRSSTIFLPATGSPAAPVRDDGRVSLAAAVVAISERAASQPLTRARC